MAELWPEVLFIPVQYLYVDSERVHLRIQGGVVVFLLVLFTVLLLVVVFLPASTGSRPSGRSGRGSRNDRGRRSNGSRSAILVLVLLLAIGLSVVSTCSLKARQKHTHVFIIVIVVCVGRTVSGSIRASVGGIRSGWGLVGWSRGNSSTKVRGRSAGGARTSGDSLSYSDGSVDSSGLIST